jgi:hypothetical protein
LIRSVFLLAARSLPVLLVLPFALGKPAWPQEATPTAPTPPPIFEVLFEASIVPTERVARASIQLGPGASNVKWMRLSIDPSRHVEFRGDGKIEVDGDSVLWTPPRRGGRLHYSFVIDRLRTTSSYDARCTESWALFRGDHLFPPARVSMETGAESRSRMRLRAPEGWSVVTPYAKRGGVFVIDHDHRRYKRPTGWIVAGRLGVLRERIAGVNVAVAGPVGQGMRRHDIVAFLRWTLPAVRRAGWELPDRLLIVGAGDPMWRGGLSGPRSVYLHNARPLITGDLTSPVLHEIVHAVTNARAGPGGGWLVEGLAELYSLEFLLRSRTVSKRRYERALERFAERGAPVRLTAKTVDGAVTARAVTVLRALDVEIRKATEGEAGLDDVVGMLAARREAFTSQLLRDAVAEVLGRDLDVFFRTRVPATEPPAPWPLQAAGGDS